MKPRIGSPVSWIEDLIEVFKLVEQGSFDVRLPDSVISASPSLAQSITRMLQSTGARQQEVEKDVASAKEAIEQLLSSYEELTALQLLSASLSTTFEREEVMNLFVNLAGEIVEYQSCLLFIPEGLNFKLFISRNVTPDLEQVSISEISLNLLQWSLRENKVVTLSHEEFTGQSSPEPRSFILVPITSHQHAIGVLILACLVPNSQITQQQIIMLGLLSAQAAAACENADLYHGLKQKNIELAQLKNYLSNILENVTTGIVALDKEGRITSLNRAAERLLRLKNQEVAGKYFFEVFEEPLRSTFRQLLLASTLQEEVSNYELEADLAGTIVPLAFSTSLLRDEMEEPIGFVLACRDISESKELNAMRKLSQLKSEFLSSVSHELRTPLTSIKAYSETLLNRLDRLPRPTLIECLQIVDSEADRLARLLDDLLDFSRMESGRLKLDRKSADLKLIVEGAVNQMKLHSEKHQLIFEWSASEMLVFVDADRVRQALINLISNAIKYSPEGGEVRLNITEAERSYEVSVSDQGIGIEAENLPHVFEKFYRVEGPHMVKIGGTGLGLSITKAIVEAHEGTIGVESAVGKGTTVYFTLPKLI